MLMGMRILFFVTILVLFWGIQASVADEPENISTFDPNLFQFPDTPESIPENLSVVTLISSESSDSIQGTGNVSKTITLIDGSGGQSVTYLSINGSDETSWSYRTEINNGSPYFYGKIFLTVTDADQVQARSYGIANERRDISLSFVELSGDVSGRITWGSAFPNSQDPMIPGPESMMEMNGLSGSGTIQEQAVHSTDPYPFEPVIVGNLEQMRPAGFNATEIIAGSGEEHLNLTERMESGLLDIQSPDTGKYSMRITQFDDGYIGSGRGFVHASVNEVITTQRMRDLDAASLMGYAIHHNSEEGTEGDGLSYIGGIDLTDFSSSGEIINYGSEGLMENWVAVPAGTGFSSETRFNIGNTGIRDSITGDAFGTSSDGSVQLSGEQELIWDDSSSSLSATYDGSAPYLTHSGMSSGGKSAVQTNFESGGLPGQAPVAIKGYVKSQGSATGTGSASTQNLFYVDSQRRTPLNWDSLASRDGESSEPVKTTGSSTSGSQFVRQKAYADRSSLSAT